jgi:3-hydroxyisobutyrate dehydrogenase-like beta-hydroxyacid dehydrogenase
MSTPSAAIGFIGFGEAGGLLGAALARRGCAVRAWDILLDDTDRRAAMQRRIEEAGANPAGSLAECLRGAKLVISAVTASSAGDVAAEAGCLMQPGQVYLDINSVSPDSKRANAASVQASGADYIDAAVMAPVPPLGLSVPMLLGGARAAELSAALNALGFSTRAVASEVGVASAIKMCRSVVIKGLEALAVESLLTARHYGAEDAVLASLAATLPSMGWEGAQPDYLIGRVAEHGTRRAAELREVAQTVRAAGLTPHMAEAIANRQEALIADMRTAGLAFEARQPFSWRRLADDLSRRPRRGELP